jgi:dimethylargininase
MIAITHVPSPNLSRCELTHVKRSAIDYSRACEQHAAYRETLEKCGATVVTLDVNRDLPDCCFVEDTAVVLDEIAILTPMGTQLRRGEPAGIEPELRKYRDVVRINLPATLEGGDVLHAGRTLFVGVTARTNPAGVEALAAIARRFAYRVVPASVKGCLHLQTAVTALDDWTLLVNPAWLDVHELSGFDFVRVPAAEPWAANVARVGTKIVAAAGYPRTADLICGRGYEVRMVDVSEFAKAEGGVTCLSLLINRPKASEPHQ